MITLNGITLDGMIWINEFSADSPAVAAVPCADGTSVLFSQKADVFDIDLESPEDAGWLSLDEALRLREAASNTEGVYVFSYRGKEYRVRFRHEDPPALKLTPVSPSSGYGQAGSFYGRIRLKTV